MIARIRAKIQELEGTIKILQALDDGPKSQWEHLTAALEEIGRPANVRTLVNAMQANGWETESKNPGALLTVTLRNKEKQGMIIKMGRGLWGKPEWVTAGQRIASRLRKPREEVSD